MEILLVPISHSQKMRWFVALVYIIVVIAGCLAVPEDCTSTSCRRESGCVCASTTSPIALAQTPQFVVLTFDDAVTDQLYTYFYEPVLFGRRNPDGTLISGTFFVPHEYSDYERVNQLYNMGFEIGANSISKSAFTEYWASANRSTLTREFGGERVLISHFANISIDSIKGARTPDLQLRGSITFEAYNDSGLSYDNSWPTTTNDLLFPYTLDYESPQVCMVGSCPMEPFPGFWVAPILNMRGHDGVECNVILGCVVEGTIDEIFSWLQGQFNRTYNGNKAPVPLLINSAWFSYTVNSFEAFLKFLDYLATLPDVYLTSMNQVIEWMKNPVAISNYTVRVESRNSSCSPRTCALDVSETEVRYMKSCVPCPAVYPWVGNPLGEGW